MIFNYIRSSLWNVSNYFFFPQRTKVKSKESYFPVFTYYLGFFFFKTNLFQKLYILNVSTKSIYKNQIHKRDFRTWWTNSRYSMVTYDKKIWTKAASETLKNVTWGFCLPIGGRGCAVEKVGGLLQVGQS